MFLRFLTGALAARLCKPVRPADANIGGNQNPYLKRWFVIPRNRFLNIYLHQFLRDDDDRALHDHPWPSVSLLLTGEVMEVYRVKNSRLDQTRILYCGQFVYRRATFAHRIVLPKTAEGLPRTAWTLFITGPRLRKWGFLCPKGWRSFEDFTAPGDGANKERGCD